MRISDWSSDVCSSDLPSATPDRPCAAGPPPGWQGRASRRHTRSSRRIRRRNCASLRAGWPNRSEEHTSELQSLMRISYAVFCLKKKKKSRHNKHKVYSHTHETNSQYQIVTMQV